jgi:hypothetical protein
MRTMAVAVMALWGAQCSQAGETRTRFEAIAASLTTLVQQADTGAVIARSATSFTVRADTMVYTVHGEGKSGDFSPKTHQETGPRGRGFVINMSVLPILPIASFSGVTTARPYWREYLWHGHGDGEEYLHFVFKFGRQVDQKLEEQIIRAVAGTAVQPSEHND